MPPDRPLSLHYGYDEDVMLYGFAAIMRAVTGEPLVPAKADESARALGSGGYSATGQGYAVT